jgi:propionyl-CoA carboxylase alpha chain
MPSEPRILKGEYTMVKAAGRSFQFVIEGEVHRVSLACESGNCHVQIGGRQFEAKVWLISENCLSLKLGNRSVTVYLAKDRDFKYISIDGKQFRVEEIQELPQSQAFLQTQSAPTDSAIASPMPGQVVKIQVVQGEIVERSQTLAIVEAMKMENELRSPRRARVRKICAAPGDLVDAGQPIVELEEG